MQSRVQMLGLMMGLLLAAVVLACLFSLFLPASASLLAPTDTPVPSPTLQPSLTCTPTTTLTPASTTLPAFIVTQDPGSFPGFAIYWTRPLWEEAVGSHYPVEDFQTVGPSSGEISLPFLTGNNFVLDGKRAVQVVQAPELLSSQNLLLIRDWKYGLKVNLPKGARSQALAFDYAAQSEWQLSVSNIGIILPSGSNRFVGVVLSRAAVGFFQLSGPPTAQSGFFVDNISYVP